LEKEINQEQQVERPGPTLILRLHPSPNFPSGRIFERQFSLLRFPPRNLTSMILTSLRTPAAATMVEPAPDPIGQ